MSAPAVPERVHGAIRAAIGARLRGERRMGRRLLGVVGLAIGLLGLGHLGLTLRELLNVAEQAPLWRVMGMLALVLIPTAGIYSLVTQYAFWEGWIEGLPEPAGLFATPPPSAAHAPRRFVVYLDGIHQRQSDHPPRITAFLRRLAGALGPDTRLVEAIEAYTVLPVGLAEEPGSAWFWRRLLNLQEQHPNGLVQVLAGTLVQANNVIKVGISSDRRYGPILNVEQALKVAEQLAEAGFHPSVGATITLLGYSGGGEMAMGMADDLGRICRCPVHIITFCGVFSGNQDLSRVEAITTISGGRDPMELVGRLVFPGRCSLLPFSRWNQARGRGLVRNAVLPGMTHNGNGGPFSERHRDAVIGAIGMALEVGGGSDKQENLAGRAML
ncbi:MAG: alpha/beta hydrolase [Cyanobacteriota bacterium]|jgi:hypothetical protein